MHVRGTSVAVFTRVSTAARELAILFSSLYETSYRTIDPFYPTLLPSYGRIRIQNRVYIEEG